MVKKTPKVAESLSRKQIVFIALNPPAWVYLLVRYGLWRGLTLNVVWPTLLAITNGVGDALISVVAFVMWDYRNKVEKKYVTFKECKSPMVKHQSQVGTFAILAAMLVAVIAFVFHVAVLEYGWASVRLFLMLLGGFITVIAFITLATMFDP